MDIKFNSLACRLRHLLDLVQGQDVPVKLIIDTLAGKGQAALVTLLVLPFCQPLQIPGLSTLFGILLFFIGLRIAFGHGAWIPKSLLEKKIPYHVLEKVAAMAIAVTDKLSFFTSTRWVYFVNAPALHVCHGLAIAVLAALLALPIPVPLTNLLAAYPMLAFGLALLEEDGLMVCVAYFLFFLCLSAFGALLFFALWPLLTNHTIA